MEPVQRTLEPASRAALWAAIGLAGFAVMAIEVASARLFAPYFGTSSWVWGSLLGGVMGALALGYGVGGWRADRAADDRDAWVALAGAGAWLSIVPWVAPSTLAALAARGDVVGPLLATTLLLLPPLALLAAIAPIGVRLLVRDDAVGRISGRVSAVSTVAGVAGALGTSLWLLPSYGVRATWLGLCAATLLLAAFGLARRHRAGAAVALLAAVGAYAPAAPDPEGTVWVAESAYHLVRVVRRRDATALLLDHETSMHSLVREGKLTGRYYDDFALGPLLVDHPERALLLGMGAGASLRPMWMAAPDLVVDAVEIDPKVVEAGERFFGLDRDDPRLRVHVADARPWLASRSDTWDVVGIDLYQSGPYVPFYLATAEFYALVRARTSDDGVVVVNVFDPSATGDLLGIVGETLRTSFASLVVLSRPSGNHTVYAFPKAQSIDSIRARLVATVVSAEVDELASRAAPVLGLLTPREGALVFTDDHAPVEEITRKALISGASR